MDRNSAIIVTGAAGFIGSCMVGYLNRNGYDNIIIVDDFSEEEKKPNYRDKKIYARIEREELFDWLANDPVPIGFVFHLGARTDTTEFDYSIHEKLNVEYSKKIWNYCTEKNISLVYASSAATYGGGEFGYKDDHDIVEKLQPLNPYGVSKNEFDKWALKQKKHPPFWAGLKFFNVYGPNEYHKGRMASVIFHAYNQARETGKVKLFRSHKPEYRDGEQLRDFIYVEDVLNICYWFMQMAPGERNIPAPGLYNVGTGKARTFKDLVEAIFSTLHLAVNIEFIDTPIDIRGTYQYFTEADMAKLTQAGYKEKFFTLESGIQTYVENFLLEHRYY
jgi:ADP-L-glycero-D-manno-heptose 6-epimerase